MDLVVLEKEEKRIEKNRVIKFFKSKIFRKAIFITLFFFVCYISTEMLNGNDMQFRKLLGFSTPWEESNY
jgi:uncharacterized membrane protein (DUF485 family)